MSDVFDEDLEKYVDAIVTASKKKYASEEYISGIKQFLLCRVVERPGPLPTPCLIWLGTKRREGGYGVVKFKGRRQPAHRVFWEVFVGEIPTGKQCNHHCDNKLCCEIEHLYIGDQLDNMRDRSVRERHGSAKLTTAQVIQIRELIALGCDQTVIARRFDTGSSQIGNIARGKKWSCVGGPLSVRQHVKQSRFINVCRGYNNTWKAQLRLKNKKNLNLGFFSHEADAAVCVNYHIAYLGLNRPLNVITEADWHHD
jgi:hypothetical protein